MPIIWVVLDLSKPQNLTDKHINSRLARSTTLYSISKKGDDKMRLIRRMKAWIARDRGHVIDMLFNAAIHIAVMLGLGMACKEYIDYRQQANWDTVVLAIKVERLEDNLEAGIPQRNNDMVSLLRQEVNQRYALADSLENLYNIMNISIYVIGADAIICVVRDLTNCIKDKR